MRTRTIVITAALVLASTGLAPAGAGAQEPQQTQSQTRAQTTEAATPKNGTIDFGTQFSSVDGDRARFERFRDLRNGGNLNVSYNRGSSTYLFEATASNIGYRDGHYVANYDSGRVKFAFVYDRIPLNYSFETRTPWVEVAENDFALDVNARTAVQNNKLPGGLVGVPANAAQAAQPSIYRDLANVFTMSQQRDTIAAAAEFQATQNLTATFSITSYKRSGNMPWGASFAFNNANELPLTVDNRTTDFSTGLEYANAKGSIRVGYDGSFFDNHTEFLVWDNPMQATDYNSNATTITGYDPSGYSNGRGPAQGLMSLPPSSYLNSVNAIALYKLPNHSTVSGTFYVTSMKQNAFLAPWTSNPVIGNPAVYSQFPELAELPRETAEASILFTNAAVNFTTRPNRWVGVTAKYRYNNRDDRTPTFNAEEYVRFDAVPEETGGETEPLNIRRNTFDATVSFNPIAFTQFRVGYGYEKFDRTGRSFNDTTENAFRASVDTVGNQYVMVRGLYEHLDRTGHGFSEASLEEGGGQPGLRFYDEADRTRDQGTLILDVTPVSVASVTFSLAAGKDTYGGPGHEFGLLDNDHHIYTVGLNLMPSDQVNFGATYGWEKYTSLQKSRNANPPPDPSFTDPSRDWTLSNPERINTFNLYLDVLKAIRNTDIRLGYDYSDSDQGFVFGGPRIPALAAVGQFIPLPNVTNKWNHLTADVRYFFTSKVGLGASYWFEKLDISDYAAINLDDTEVPRIDYLGEISTGYGNRPYKAHTGFLRLFYLF